MENRFGPSATAAPHGMPLHYLCHLSGMRKPNFPLEYHTKKFALKKTRRVGCNVPYNDGGGGFTHGKCGRVAIYALPRLNARESLVKT